MPRITCPQCKAAFEAPESDLAPGRCVRCAQCGVSIPAAAAQPDVAFPKHAKDETVLGLDETVKALRRKLKKD